MSTETHSPFHRALAFVLAPSTGGRATVAIRTAVAGVFVVSGVLKFLFANQGPARFAKLGLPADLAYFVGGVEIVCGTLLLVGLFTRLAAVPLVIDMLVALATTKVPLLYGPGPEPIAAMPKTGWWAFAYQARLDGAMLIACVYLAIVGAGLWSVDAILSQGRRGSAHALSNALRSGDAAAQLAG